MSLIIRIFLVLVPALFTADLIAQRDAGGDWPIERIAIARSNGVAVPGLQIVVIDGKRVKGNGFVRETIALRASQAMWYLRDTGSKLFPSYLARYAPARKQWESPSDAAGALQRSSPLVDLDPVVRAEIRWLGLPLTCPGSSQMGERYAREGTVEVIVTTPCSKLEFNFLINDRTGLPTRLDIWAPETIDASSQKRVARRRIESTVYLAWNDGAWRMPTRVLLESNIRHLTGDWIRTEYVVESWINPRLDPEFFDLNMNWEMTAETWKRFLR